jgi:hypothetical protein
MILDGAVQPDVFGNPIPPASFDGYLGVSGNNNPYGTR